MALERRFEASEVQNVVRKAALESVVIASLPLSPPSKRFSSLNAEWMNSYRKVSRSKSIKVLLSSHSDDRDSWSRGRLRRSKYGSSTSGDSEEQPAPMLDVINSVIFALAGALNYRPYNLYNRFSSTSENGRANGKAGKAHEINRKTLKLLIGKQSAEDARLSEATKVGL